ncbi:MULTISPECIES: sucrose-6-phosphate hydrolase [Vagococcus]|uniref:Sucrose-6-phosphate hydrolase n=1 Tax=Vagococcus fluvialis bH819 TaxID=1255619 RepID=A0A1X6WJM1_9ENTE|nr:MULTISPECIES: sucrose-6-phosphate hydrolase [Vagococcus]SLM84503.1 Sucrose-6-phosphate hydrolase [Vagococcus fluvialis bH819]HCM90541.1 sucrose-6-phosphate hydrolase [Vagococcus sp.]
MTRVINEWSRELRYQSYKNWSKDYTSFLEKNVKDAPWRLNYHIQPKSGLLNDPNGFSYFNNEWHLFYQFYPFGAVHGLKSWYHLTSKNLVDWTQKGIALEPSYTFDSHGVYSGTAFPIGEELFLSYSGNVRDEEWHRQSYQLGAMMKKDSTIKKINSPLVDFPIKGYTDHVRDPQIISYKGNYLMILGAQNSDEEGKIIIFESTNLTDWDLLGDLNYTHQKIGFMVECPNLLFVEEQPLLIFCPQGLDKSIMSYENIYPNTYILGDSFDLKHLTINSPSEIKNLDYGFDVYATQAFTDENGRCLSISWLGLPEIDYPTFKDGWAHCLSLVKELTIKEGKLYQFPVIETAELREDATSIKGTLTSDLKTIAKNTTNSYELNLSFSSNSSGVLHLFSDNSAEESFKLFFDTKKGVLKIDRQHAGVSFAEEFGVTRSLIVPKNKKLELDIFVDQSTIEIFINKGEDVMTSRIFPEDHQTNLMIEGQNGDFFGTIYSLRKMKN